METIKARRIIVNILYELWYSDMYQEEITAIVNAIKENEELKKENKNLEEEIDRLNSLYW